MSLITVRDLTFHYEGSPENVFEHVSFQIDTDWKLGFISRNGRGKTTFLKLLAGEMPYQGAIEATVGFECFPYAVKDTGGSALSVIRNAVASFDAWEAEMEACLAAGDEASLHRYGTLQELMLQHDGYLMDELIAKEAGKLLVEPDALARPYATLSYGERTKLQIAAMFLKKNRFLLIDEPTNHLDMRGREALEGYLNAKKGFILVSHDRVLLDGVVDHVLSINRADIEVQRGNYSSWRSNREMQDQHEMDRNVQLKREIGRLHQAQERNERWSDAIEATKIGTHTFDRGAVGAQAARMMKRAKAVEKRTQSAIEEKTQLLKNVETAEALKLHPLAYHKRRLLDVQDLQIDYGTGPLFAPLSFMVEQNDRLALTGPNGAGKSSILKLLLGENIPHSGRITLGNRMVISYVSQDTAHLRGDLRAFAQQEGIDITLFLTILRKLDFEREAFERPVESYSAGQKKKVLIAASLSTQAHLYLWDEPLNYIDILSRIQIETLLSAYPSTMVFIEHDRAFVERIATEVVVLEA